MDKVQGSRFKSAPPAYRLQLITYSLLFTALLLAGFLRLWQLDTLPLGLYHDEAYNGLDIRRTDVSHFP